MTPEEICQLDGVALSQMALDLRLAPEGTELWDDLPYASFQREPWEPHLRLEQADEVFRGLRALGWSTTHSADATGGTVTTIQWCHRHSYTGRHMVYDHRQDVPYGRAGQPTEAHALLLVSVLAVASTAPRPPHAAVSACDCIWSTAGWLQHHGQPTPEIADAAARLSEALGLEAEDGA